MCGIFGMLINEDGKYRVNFLKHIIDRLFVLSESRGKDASGIALLSGGKMYIRKDDIIASAFIREREYKLLLDEAVKASLASIFDLVIKKPIAVIGQCRLATNGSQSNNNNNCPLTCGDVTGVHNGIIVNDDLLWDKFLPWAREGTTDSELLIGLADIFIKSGMSLSDSLRSVFRNIEGSASVVLLIPGYGSMALATNTGSIYIYRNKTCSLQLFASEPYILRMLVKERRLLSAIGEGEIFQLKAGRGMIVDVNSFTFQGFDLN